MKIKKNIRTRCPHTFKEDRTNIEMIYTPGKYEIDEEELVKYIQENIEGEEITMEMIPLKILEFCIESTSMRKPPSRYASPREVRLKSFSYGKGKSWSMEIEVIFKRRIKERI